MKRPRHPDRTLERFLVEGGGWSLAGAMSGEQAGKLQRIRRLTEQPDRGTAEKPAGAATAWWLRVRAVIVAVFAVLFLTQVFVSVTKLLYNNTISTVKWKPFEQGFPLPAVTICSYTNINSNLTLDQFVLECNVITDTCEEAMGKYLEVTTVNLDTRRCFTFTTSQNAPLNEKDNGIAMRLAFQPDDIVKDKVEVYLHGKAEAYNPFFVLGLDRNIEIPLGKSIKLELMVEMSKYLNGYGHMCREEPGYTYVGCLRFCFEEKLIEAGPRCKLDWMIPHHSAPLCTEEDTVLNFSRVVEEKGLTVSQDHPECEASCDQACVTYNYRGVEYSSLVQTKLVENKEAKFKFRFRDTYYTAIEEVINYDFWSMIGEVGGTLGFLLGLSLLSILDLLADGVKWLNNWRIRRKGLAARLLVVRAKF
ncbi:uncharacterized protein LOC122377274 [Amphibalanus amphitrite]|uniref:uncharacterized protein LOC122377274 n=1 Tax=Amphibalanus amphitrite TaxID=1232801 RepID=UPI001C911E10|nr:uncharacterized protein LOC122377274 [Amphibalanus amphitrite]